MLVTICVNVRRPSNNSLVMRNGFLRAYLFGSLMPFSSVHNLMYFVHFYCVRCRWVDVLREKLYKPSQSLSRFSPSKPYYYKDAMLPNWYFLVWLEKAAFEISMCAPLSRGCYPVAPRCFECNKLLHEFDKWRDYIIQYSTIVKIQWANVIVYSKAAVHLFSLKIFKWPEWLISFCGIREVYSLPCFF